MDEGKKRRILFLDAPHPSLIPLLEGEWELDFMTEAGPEKVLKQLPNYFGLIVRSRIRLDEAFLSRGTSLRFIGRLGVGVEHIDLEACRQRNIEVFTTPEGSRDTVGEHTLGLLLSLMNNLARADRQIREGAWLRQPNTGVEIKGKTVGILGYGNMGQAFARRLQGFGARVITYDKFRSDYGDAYAEAVDLATLRSESHILSIHIPLIPSNQYFVDGAFLDGFAHDLFIVNTARGPVLHTAELVDRLRSGKVLGAALDVLEYEEQSFSRLELDKLPAAFQYLRRSDRVVLSPHIAGWSVESAEGHARVLAEKIHRRFSTSSPVTQPAQKK